MRRAFKRLLLPALQDLGFHGRGSTFQRALPQSLDLLSIQYWKYGGEFLLECARRERGPLHTSWGEVVPEEKLDVAYVDPRQRARLEQRGPTAGPGFQGFCFAGFGEDVARYEGLAAQVVALLPEVDAWLAHGRAGTHLRPYFNAG